MQDACQAHGALAAASGTAAYSFYPTKNLPCLGDGGALTTDSAAVAGKRRACATAAATATRWRARPPSTRGWTRCRPAICAPFLPRLAEWNARRAHLARLYDQALAGSAAVTPLARREGSVRHGTWSARGSAKLRAELARHGIATGIHYPVPLHRQPVFGEVAVAGQFPVAERACREALSLPFAAAHAGALIAEVCERIRAAG